MGYFDNLSAESVLEGTSLKVTVPTCALSLKGVSELLGLNPKKKEHAINYGRTLPKNEKEASVVCVTVKEEIWQWEEESFSFFNENGEEDCLMIKKNLSIDERMERNIERMKDEIHRALSTFGIPHDITFQSAIPNYDSHSVVALAQGRLNKENPLSACLSIEVKEKPNFEEIVALTKECKDLEEFKEILADFENKAIPIKEDARLFEEILVSEDYKKFLEAGLSFFNTIKNPTGFYDNIKNIKWKDELALWSKVYWEGENPIDRMAENGEVSKKTLKNLLEIAVQQAEPCEELMASSLNAYCRISTPTCSPQLVYQNISISDVLVIGKAIEAYPKIIELVKEKAEKFFTFNLESKPEKMQEADFALAEALWLRAQSYRARSEQTMKISAVKKSL